MAAQDKARNSYERPSAPDGLLPKDAYLSKEFLELEKQRLWPRIWQAACRLEEIPKAGDYVVYEVADQSVIVVRIDAQTIKAYHNVCQHRGRRLLSGVGRTRGFYCRFHGWQWNMDGSIAQVINRHEFDDCANFNDDALRLKETLVDIWGGWVFINMDRNAEPLAEYLSPVPQFLDPFEMHTWRYRWYKTVVVDCNWKVAMEAFDEQYHTAGSHPQTLEFADDNSRSRTFGKHGNFYYPSSNRPFGSPAPRTGKTIPNDFRPAIFGAYKQVEEQLAAIWTERDLAAASRLLSEFPPGASAMEVTMKMIEFQKEAAIASGAGWPDVSIEHIAQTGINWHLFPNLIVMFYFDGAISYRARPNGDNPDSCIFDIVSLVRYAPGTEPPLRREFYPNAHENAVANFGLIPSQDLANMVEVQKGMKSMGFAGSRINPVQESAISNLHRVVYEYLFEKR